MKGQLRLASLVLALCAPLLAQELAVRGDAQVFESIGSEGRALYTKDQIFEARRHEFHALPDSVTIQQLNMNALDVQNRFVTIGRGPGKNPLRIENSVLSQSQQFWFVKTWTGDVVDPQTGESFAFKLSISAMAMDEEGGLHFPDLNRPLVDRAMQSDAAVLPKSSYDRRKEGVIWMARGMIPIAWENTKLKITPLESKPGDHVLYDIDVAKWADSPRTPRDGPLDQSPDAIANRERYKAEYDAFIRNLKSELELE